MQSNINTSQPVYVAPANPAGRALASALTAEGYNVCGLADNLKQADGIINSHAQSKPDAIVIICNGPYTHNVAKGLMARGFAPHQLYTSFKEDVDTTAPTSSSGANSHSNTHSNIHPYKTPISEKFKSFRFRLLSSTIKVLRSIVPQRGYVYYAEQFFDTNMLLAYRQHRRQYPDEPWLIGRNIKQDLTMLDADNHLLRLFSLLGLWKMVRAKKMVVDHEFTGNTFTLFREFIPVVQLWHGLPYKALSGNIHYPDICDDAFISSSSWFNEHIFPTIFRAKRYLDFGYPRNDVFSQSPEARDWINAEPLSTLTHIQNTTGSIVVYAPTYRDWGDNDYPLDLDKINAWCENNKRSFVLKFHPFISRQFGDAMALPDSENVQALPSHPHIYLYPSGKNIYPWLADAETLVTDYSSIAYDFLLADKPIIYFQYDKQDYLKLRGNTLVSDSDFIAGEVAEDVDSMLVCLSRQTSATLTLQKALKHKFNIQSQQSASMIVSYIRE
ncbi:CDP-glycerol glycerophosphotransferase family protein [Alteromonas sp. CI.11.F.A3]|uniref:CDP-glycerol glycerophosphotransferase family protein n=1 Tax=Alteromonas sp. CI.11.F.A3 TaxID=3079555 RepID=UPI0029434BF9|nr:CDP-glycerol glycerophosphotransferase family protein [Alteromonas sp. CI.11.F.A3]WOI36636.1 CDP-glycerol glycerophosphotransferase family protein [Alteromonas sp. CI.11.F.A3]